MRFLSLPAFFSFTFLITIFSCITNKADKPALNISGRITETRNYCGGAKPTESMLAELQRARPLAGKKVFVKNGEVNDEKNLKIVAEAVSDDSGNFTLSLPPGKYLVVDETKKDRTYYNKLLSDYKEKTDRFHAVDTACLSKWYKLPLLTFEVSEGKTEKLDINFEKKCEWNSVPCTKYHGPLPH